LGVDFPPELFKLHRQVDSVRSEPGRDSSQLIAHYANVLAHPILVVDARIDIQQRAVSPSPAMQEVGDGLMVRHRRHVVKIERQHWLRSIWHPKARKNFAHIPDLQML